LTGGGDGMPPAEIRSGKYAWRKVPLSSFSASKGSTS
jgi:hypothetical protein